MSLCTKLISMCTKIKKKKSIKEQSLKCVFCAKNVKIRPEEEIQIKTLGEKMLKL